MTNEISGRQLAKWFAEIHPEMTVVEAETMRCLATSDAIKDALRGILAEPHGCSLCDYGIPRNPDKGHQPDCPYQLAKQALGLSPTTEQGKEGEG